MKLTCSGGQWWLGRTNSPLKLKFIVYQIQIKVMFDRPHIFDQIWRGDHEIFSEMSEGVAQNAETATT